MEIRNYVQRVRSLWRGLSLWQKYALSVAFFALIVGGIYAKNMGGSAVADAPALRAVHIATVSDIMNDATPLPLIGEVQSVNEATIRAQAGGAVRHLYKKLGEYVPAGGIIAELENASEHAALLQAQGALESAQASVQKSSKLFSQSKTSTLDTVRAAYSTNDDLVRSKLDAMFSNPTGNTPKFVLTVSDQSLLNKIESTRLQLNTILKNESARSASISESTDLALEIQTALKETRAIKEYIDDLSALLNAAISSQAYPQSAIDGFITLASVARTAVSGSLASLSGASQALTAAQNDAQKPDEVSSSDATLKQAQAGVSAAEARLEDTIIRAPISGTINSLSINLGDFVSAFQQVAVVSNNGALQIVAHITPEDRATIVTGAKVKIENTYDGFVTSMTSAIDPATKKIEIKIGLIASNLSSESRPLANGELVHLDIVRAPKSAATKTAQIMLPVSAVKIGTQNALVFTVDAQKKLVAHEVKLGELIADKIQILDGVSADMAIVIDARGLKDGQEVDVQ